ncbi:MAG: hypothetical protein Q9184_004159 [Pyrenodesmia sp. 2 TL-2023]
MDDLSGLSWTSSTLGDSNKKPPPMTQSSYPYTLKSTPLVSGRSTPITAQETKPLTNGISRSNASTPANDSFANLVPFNAVDPSKNLSLQERQKKLQEERARKQQEKAGSVFGGQDEEFWEKLGSGRSSPNPIGAPPRYAATADYGGHRMSKTINKPFAGIDFDQRRPSQPSTNGNGLPADFEDLDVDSANRGKESKPRHDIDAIGGTHGQGQLLGVGTPDNIMLDDDDPFGLGSIAASSRPTVSATQETTGGDDDDVLGLLGRPVSEFVPPKEPSPPLAERAEVVYTSPADRALAELIDMGFAPEKSKQALDATETGIDVQAAVGLLLHRAHEESRGKSHGRQSQSRRQESRPGRMSPPRKRSLATESAQPAWMKNTAEESTHQSRQSSRSPVNGEKDPSKIAAELGNNLFKTANSLWKTGTKKLNQAVAEMSSDSDSSQPKWMRDPRGDRGGPARQPHSPQEGAPNGNASAKLQQQTTIPDVEVTDEALMLESADARPPPRKPARPKTETNHQVPRPRPASPVTQSFREDVHRPKFMQQPTPQRREDPRSRLSKQLVEEQTTEAYISPARRKKIAPKPPTPEPDLLFESSRPPSEAATLPLTNKPPPRQPPLPQPDGIPQPPRSYPHPRKVPPISPSALHTSHASRRAGTAAFKLGNYAEATAHYTSALSPLPSTHPLHIPLLSNRALSHLKTGEPKACIADTQTALGLIGPSGGIGESVDLGDEGAKDIRDYWGKAMTRQAEALEQLEKWSEAGNVWKTCVEAGVGGATSIAGRNRCEKAIHGPSRVCSKPAAAKKPPPKPKPKPQVSALDDLTGTTTHTNSTDSEAVSRLRIANAALERLDDEKFALADTVSDRVFRWRSGKENNLRALLASLDRVLWEGSGWKKVGMGELILPGKVKVVYMKGIGKCHPDKLPTTATTEQKMISAAVFATLNEAWDGFKRENGL